jgi:hypothetical protein
VGESNSGREDGLWLSTLACEQADIAGRHEKENRLPLQVILSVARATGAASRISACMKATSEKRAQNVERTGKDGDASCMCVAGERCGLT